MGISARRVGQLLLVPVWAVVVVLLGIAVAHLFAFDEARVFMLANAYTLWIYLPAYPIAVAAACFRAWPLAAAALLIVIAQLAWVVPPTFRTEPVDATTAGAPHVRIASANVRFDNRDRGPLLRELEGDDADIVVLEEITPAWWHAIERSRLPATHRFVARAIRDNPGGMAILSRLPLTDVVVHDAAGWPIITITVETHGHRFHLAGIHPIAPLETFERNQRSQRAITAIARRLPRPRILVGDFNATPYNRWYRDLLDLGLHDAHESVGRTFATTWPNGMHHLPPLLLDHLLADPAIVALSAREGRGDGSDHRPIVVEVALDR